MWFSPGIFLAAIAACLVYYFTGDTSQWWLWLVLVIGAMLIDGALGIVPKRKVKVKRTTEYEREK